MPAMPNSGSPQRPQPRPRRAPGPSGSVPSTPGPSGSGPSGSASTAADPAELAGPGVPAESGVPAEQALPAARLPISEFLYDRAGAASPFGDDVTFPLPAGQVAYR